MTPRPGTEYPLDLHGWFRWQPTFEAWLLSRKPMQCVEVGVWLGASALFTAEHIRKWGGKITCVDTWEPAHNPLPGDIAVEEKLHSAYDRFLSNVWHLGLQDTVDVVRGDSTAAIVGHPPVDFAYIDGGHEFGPAIVDLNTWWLALKKGGLLVGDDFGMDGVHAAWVTFAHERSLRLENEEGQLVWTEK